MRKAIVELLPISQLSVKIVTSGRNVNSTVIFNEQIHYIRTNN